MLNSIQKFMRKLHRWVAIPMGLLLLLMAITGLMLHEEEGEHRQEGREASISTSIQKGLTQVDAPQKRDSEGYFSDGKSREFVFGEGEGREGHREGGLVKFLHARFAEPVAILVILFTLSGIYLWVHPKLLKIAQS